MGFKTDKIIKGDFLIVDGVSPTNIPDLKLWLDAADASTINSGTPVNNDIITSIANKAVGSSLVFTITGSPLYKSSSYSSLPALAVSGANIIRSQIDTEVSLNKTVIIVYRVAVRDLTTSTYTFLINTSNSVVSISGNYISLAIFNSGAHQFRMNDSTGYQYNVSLASGVNTTPFLLIAQANNTPGMVKFAYKYNQSVARPATLLVPNTPYLFLGGGVGTTESHISEVLIYDRVLSDLELTSLRKYLTIKWNL